MLARTRVAGDHLSIYKCKELAVKHQCKDCPLCNNNMELSAATPAVRDSSQLTWGNVEWSYLAGRIPTLDFNFVIFANGDYTNI